MIAHLPSDIYKRFCEWLRENGTCMVECIKESDDQQLKMFRRFEKEVKGGQNEIESN